MLYPVILSSIGEDLTLFVPDPDQVKPCYEKQLAADAATPFPFWAKIWASAYAMASFLQEHPLLVKNKKVLELGAGIGVPSFVISNLTAELIISDHSQDAVELIKKNIDHLSLKNVTAVNIDWNNFNELIATDVLLLSDINYATDQFGPLLKIIDGYLTQHTTIILSTPQRINITPFAEYLQPFVRQSVLHIHKDGSQETEIRILVLSK